VSRPWHAGVLRQYNGGGGLEGTVVIRGGSRANVASKKLKRTKVGRRGIVTGRKNKERSVPTIVGWRFSRSSCKGWASVGIAMAGSVQFFTDQAGSRGKKAKRGCVQLALLATHSEGKSVRNFRICIDRDVSGEKRAGINYTGEDSSQRASHWEGTVKFRGVSKERGTRRRNIMLR